MYRGIIAVAVMALTFINLHAATIWVDVEDDYFQPSNLYVPEGTTVTWTNHGVHTHTVTDSSGMFDSGDLLPGQSFSYTYNTAGDYDYYCYYHVLVGMVGVVHVRTQVNLTFLLTTVPVGGPIVIPVGGGSFTYTATLTNQTSTPQPFQYWVKAYLPNMTPYPVLGPIGATLPGNQTRDKQFSQNVPGSAPAGNYHYVSYVGTMPDTVLAWSSFDFTKSAVLDMNGWESHEMSDWYTASAAEPTSSIAQTGENRLGLSNSPEPFNPSTVISYTLPAAGLTHLEVYNVAGARVATLVDGYRESGQHQMTFEAGNLPSGLYVYRLSFGGETVANKMMLVK